jgi:phage tail-like protein
LTLKRGMTANYDLWKWFGKLYEPNQGGLRGNATVVSYAPDGKTQQAQFNLTGCLPVKLKAPALNAKDGAVAIEEFQLAYETLQFVPPS